MRVERLPSGNYNTRIMVKGKRISITCPTASECRRQASILRAEMLEGNNPPPKVVKTLREACRRFIWDRRAVLSPSTIRGYEKIMENRFPSVMDLRIGKISNWQEVINAEARVVSPKTLKNAWGFIHAVLLNEGFDPPKVTLPAIPKSEQAWLTVEEMKRLISALYGTPCEFPALLALNGLRLSEIYALDKYSIDTEKRLIRVRGSRVQASDGYKTKKTNKNSTSTRDVPILIPRILDLALLLGDGPVTKCDQKHLCDRVNRVCRKAGVPEVGVHGLRRTFASWCASSEMRIPEDVCMKWGGWSDIYTMRKIYQKVSESDMQVYADRMRNSFGNELAMSETDPA